MFTKENLEYLIVLVQNDMGNEEDWVRKDRENVLDTLLYLVHKKIEEEDQQMLSTFPDMWNR